MPSSTSSSSSSRPTAGIHGVNWLRVSLTAIVLLAAIYGLMEFATRRFLVRSSKILSRIEADRRAVMSPRQGKPLVVLAGNSLLLFGVDMDLLRREVGSEYDIRRYAVEQTAFVDWKYGYRRLLKEGVKPDVFLLMLATRPLVGDEFRRDQFAYYQLSTEDYLPFVSDLRLHPTDATGQLLSHYSNFYANRSDVRKFILAKLVPNMANLTTRLAPVGGQLDPARVLSVSKERLRWFEQETRKDGVKFALILPPTRVDGYTEPVLEASKTAGAATLFPIAGASFPPGEFLDAHHLTEKGAKRFTESLAPALKTELDQWRAGRQKAGLRIH